MELPLFACAPHEHPCPGYPALNLSLRPTCDHAGEPLMRAGQWMSDADRVQLAAHLDALTGDVRRSQQDLIGGTHWTLMHWPSTREPRLAGVRHGLAGRMRCTHCDNTLLLRLPRAAPRRYEPVSPCCGVPMAHTTHTRVRQRGAITVPDPVAFACAYVALLGDHALLEWWREVIHAASAQHRDARLDDMRAGCEQRMHQVQFFLDHLIPWLSVEVFTRPVGAPGETPRWWRPIHD